MDSLFGLRLSSSSLVPEDAILFLDSSGKVTAITNIGDPDTK
jgi:hypothetical protein